MATAEIQHEEETMGRITTEIDLANNQDVQLWKAGVLAADKVRRVRILAVIDSGANYLVLPAATAQSLGLPKGNSVGVRYADGRSAHKETVEQVELTMLGRTGTFRALVEPDRMTALVAAIVLEDLDLLVDCGKQLVFPRDPKGIIAEIE